MSSRFNSDNNRNALFSAYDSRKASRSPAPSSSRPVSGGYGHPSNGAPGGAFSAYPGSSSGQTQAGFRSATPNSRGQYSAAVMEELESQNNEEIEGMSARVKMLKDLTSAIGVEIRDSTALAEKMNESFDGTSRRLKGTMNRMLRMAERTGVPWKVWLAFSAAVILLFWYVWLS